MAIVAKTWAFRWAPNSRGSAAWYAAYDPTFYAKAAALKPAICQRISNIAAMASVLEPPYAGREAIFPRRAGRLRIVPDY